ncbi:collagenase [Pigmentibacter sp. JX0631]|uniref:collagenase n=1 Tax=Pigmentibacter sp. JX0631 TaxID=2976982 RepID=UPI0024699677|nr:collagenase [Pigmentibacter sp. JX0631]WGL59819.1 collagenase [Pigmentibacter sp. JX0631]
MIKNTLLNFGKKYLLTSSCMVIAGINYTHLVNAKEIPSNQNYDKFLNNCMLKVSELKSTENIFNGIKNIDSKCFNRLSFFHNDSIKFLVSDENMLKVSDNLKENISNIYAEIKPNLSEGNLGTGIINSEKKQNLLKLAAILNNAYYINSLDNKYVMDTEIGKKIRNNIADITYKFAIITHSQKEESTDKKNKDYIEFKELAKEIYSLIGSSKSYEESLSLIEYVTENHDYITKNNTLLIFSIIPIQIALSASHDAGGIFYKNEENKIKIEKVVKNIQKILSTDYIPESKTFYENYILQLGKFLRYKDFQNSIVNTMKEVIRKTTGGNYKDAKEKPSTFWFEAVSALEYYGLINTENCISFVDKNNFNACKAKTNLGKSLFKNRFVYDEGAIVIHSALNKIDTNKVYYAMKQVESKFKQEMQLFEPIKKDKNKRLYVYIYPTKKDYQDYKPYASDLDKQEDGGVYIDSRGAFYTYAESPYFQDLIKHEYVHYLNSRYLYKYFAKTNSSKDIWKYMDWFVEGSAELFSGSKQDGIGISSLEYNYMKEYNKNKIPNIYEIVDSKYDASYTNRFLLNHFLFFNKRSIFDDIILSIKNNNLNNFKKIIIELLTSKELNEEFKNYVYNLSFDESSVANLKSNTETLFADRISFENSLKNLSFNPKCETISSSEGGNTIARVSCSFDYPKERERDLYQLLSSDIKNDQTNCTYNNSLKIFSCETPVLLAKRNEISSQMLKNIDAVNKEQFDRIFPVINDNFIFYKNDIYSSYLAKGNKEEGWYYNYYVNDSNLDFKVDSDGEYSLKNLDNYEKVTKTVLINGSEFHLSFFKFLGFDKRMFAKKITVRKIVNGNDDKYDLASHSLYRNEGSIENVDDGFRIFDAKFRYDEVNDYDFVIDKAKVPKGAIAEIYNRYMLYYVNKNPTDKDEVGFKVYKHGKLEGELLLKVDSSLDSSYLDEIKNNSSSFAEEINFSISNSERYLDFFIYDHISAVEEGVKYNYTIVNKPNCHTQSYVRDDGLFRFIINKQCDVLNDSVIVAMTKITNKNLEHVKNIKINFSIIKK